MAGLPRKYQPLFAGNLAGSPTGNIAIPGSRAIGPEQYSSDLAALMGTPAWLGGWAQIIVGNNSPIKQEFNGILFAAFQQIAYLLARGVAEWDGTTQYNTGDFARAPGTRTLYYSKLDTNTGNALSNTTYWGNYEALFDVAGSAASAAATAQAAAIASSNAYTSAQIAALSPQLIKGFAVFNGGDFGPPPFNQPIYESFNCASIIRTDVGQYVFNFASGMPGSNTYGISGSCGAPDGDAPGPGDNNIICGLGTVNAGGFSFGAWESRLQIFENCSFVTVFAIGP